MLLILHLGHSISASCSLIPAPPLLPLSPPHPSCPPSALLHCDSAGSLAHLFVRSPDLPLGMLASQEDIKAQSRVWPFPALTLTFGFPTSDIPVLGKLPRTPLSRHLLLLLPARLPRSPAPGVCPLTTTYHIGPNPCLLPVTKNGIPLDLRNCIPHPRAQFSLLMPGFDWALLPTTRFNRRADMPCG